MDREQVRQKICDLGLESDDSDLDLFLEGYVKGQDPGDSQKDLSREHGALFIDRVRSTLDEGGDRELYRILGVLTAWQEALEEE